MSSRTKKLSRSAIRHKPVHKPVRKPVHKSTRKYNDYDSDYGEKQYKSPVTVRLVDKHKQQLINLQDKINDINAQIQKENIIKARILAKESEVNKLKELIQTKEHEKQLLLVKIKEEEKMQRERKNYINNIDNDISNIANRIRKNNKSELLSKLESMSN
jgi:hypothetical protein